MSPDLFWQWLRDSVLDSALVLVGGFAVIVLGAKGFHRVVNQYVRDTDMRYRGRKAVSLLGYVAAVVDILVSFRAQLGGMTVALGVAGAGIAFALQEVIASAAGWLAIIFARFFATGVRGDVMDIGILRTTLMECGDWVGGHQYNGRIVRIANSGVFRVPVYNYSADFPFVWDEIRIPVTYASDRLLAQDVLQRAIEGTVGDYVPGATAA